jgi:hypothetical protein
MTSHGPTDGHAADAEMLGDRLHAEGTAAERRDNRGVAVGKARSIVIQRLCQGTALAFRDLAQRTFRVD